MNYGEIKKNDIANGEGVRVSLFVSGCRHHCRNCFNQETWSFGYGKNFTEETAHEITEALGRSYINGLTLLGGEPFEPENQRELVPFLEYVRSVCPGKTIWCYTGCVLEELLSGESAYRCEATDRMLSLIDVLVDGPFVEGLKDITLKFRGSSNQRIIDVKRTLENADRSGCGKDECMPEPVLYLE